MKKKTIEVKRKIIFTDSVANKITVKGLSFPVMILMDNKRVISDKLPIRVVSDVSLALAAS